MEYCSGGSLLSLLEEPEHSFGLQELEFRTVLECVGRDWCEAGILDCICSFTKHTHSVYTYLFTLNRYSFD